jgi:(2S)-methylsuccinyl-CoA dehydrogenase
VKALIAEGTSAELRARLIEAIAADGGSATVGTSGLDETLEAMRNEMRRFADQEVLPHAQGWHLENEYIPLAILSQMAELGVFALTIPEEFGGLGLGKESMCVVSEELSRGWIGVGSLGTRSEIAAELILSGGTQAQKEKWLPPIATGQCLPTAVFTEPNTGSDLAALKTRAVREGGVYKIYGARPGPRTARADLMT